MNEIYRFPKWGPYNKKYAGFSHIANSDKGIRFDLDIFTGFYRRNIMMTSNKIDGGAKRWASSANFEHCVYRYEISNDDAVYCDTHLTQKDGNANLKFDFVNNTDMNQVVQLNCCASMRLPSIFNHEIYAAKPKMHSSCVWINAENYINIITNNVQSQNGLRKGETHQDGACGGFALNTCAVESVKYVFESIEATDILIRYKCEKKANIKVNDMYVTLPECYDFSTVKLEINKNKYNSLSVYPMNETVTIDGFAIGVGCDDIEFELLPTVYEPIIEQKHREITLSYRNLDVKYTVGLDCENYQVRLIRNTDDYQILSENIHNHTTQCFEGDGKGFYVDLFIRPIFLEPYTSKSVNIKIVTNDIIKEVPSVDTLILKSNKAGEKYVFSQQLLAANTLMNVTYPLRMNGKYVATNTPGKQWDSFYTWDNGFIALGLYALDLNRSIESLNTYLSDIDNEQYPYLQWGTPLFTQIFVYKEMLNDGRLAECKELYPKFKKCYDYFREKASRNKTGLLQTWDVFYNSGGWDDYYAQEYVHSRNKESDEIPVISTCFLILFAKIMKCVAEVLNYEKDVVLYDDNIKALTQALLPLWDNESGYFGYAKCENGIVTGIVKNEKGINVNMGFDGIYPYVVGITDEDMSCKMLKNIKSGLMTSYGISVVDVRAPYFRKDGYWNGTIWIPPQFILWKALLDRGEGNIATQIAMSVLDVWKQEVDSTHNCYEHFVIEGGRGAGYHQFSGLSSPLLNIFNAYFCAGNVTTGFETVVLKKLWSENNSNLEITLKTGKEKFSIIVTMNDEYEYDFCAQNAKIEVEKIHKGTYLLNLEKCKGLLNLSARFC